MTKFRRKKYKSLYFHFEASSNIDEENTIPGLYHRWLHTNIFDNDELRQYNTRKRSNGKCDIQF